MLKTSLPCVEMFEKREHLELYILFQTKVKERLFCYKLLVANLCFAQNVSGAKTSVGWRSGDLTAVTANQLHSRSKFMSVVTAVRSSQDAVRPNCSPSSDWSQTPLMQWGLTAIQLLTAVRSPSLDAVRLNCSPCSDCSQTPSSTDFDLSNL